MSHETQIAEHSKSLDQRGQVKMVILNFRKAFVTVHHLSLLFKLKNIGTNDRLCEWIRNCLIGIKQSKYKAPHHHSLLLPLGSPRKMCLVLFLFFSVIPSIYQT